MLAKHLTRQLRRQSPQTLRFLATSDESKSVTKTKTSAPKFRKKKTFQFSGKDVDKTTPLEEFAYPSYWDEDYPADFDDAM
ncbi:Hypothetical protein PHPALM_18460, partial [Phytophthora palmivora]